MYKRHAGIESSEEFYLISSNGVMYSIEEPNFESMGSVNSSMVRYVLPDVGYEDATGETHYEIKDHLGNLRVSYTLEWCATCGTECLNQSVEYRIDYVADYFAYGGIMREYIRLNTEQERFLSTGNERDKLTGWDYRNARYYNSDIGRFLGVDELAVHPFQIDKSPYSGMWSNPISWTDPSGLCPTCPTAADEGATHEWAGLTFTFQYGYWSSTLSEATFTKKSDEGAYSIDYVANWVNSNNALSFQNANGGIDGGFGRGNSLLGFQHGNAQGGGRPNFQAADASTFIGLGLDLGSNLSGDHRNTLVNSRRATPIMLRVNGQSPSLAKINAWGVTSKWLGRAAVGYSVGSDTKEFLSNDITGMRYTYRMSGTVASVITASRLGGWPGATVGVGFVAGEMLYDLGSWYRTNLSKALTDIEIGLRNGWAPGRK